MKSSIEVQGVTMRFGGVTALREVNLSLEGQKIVGLLGRNGAGKTTLLSLMTNRLFPSEGQVLLDGENVRENDAALSKIFYMGEKNPYLDTTTVAQLFRYTASFYPGFHADKAAALAERFELDVKKKLKNLSTGYLTIAKLVTALATDVPYLLFDEPVLGLDANHRELFYRMLVEDYSERPRTIVLSTHLIEEIADIIEQVVILKDGQILLDKPAEEVTRMGFAVSGKAADVEAFCRGRDLLSMETLGGLKTACLLGKAEDVPPELEVSRLDMQKLFVRLTNA